MSFWINDEKEWNSPNNPLNLWLIEWNKLAPDTTPVAFTSTASDAINLIPSIIVKKRSLQHKMATVLAFDTCFAASRGPLAGLSFIPDNRAYGLDLLDCIIPSPCLWKNPLKERLTEDESKDVIKKEQKALQFIKMKATKDQSVGAIFVEPIVGPYGVYFYRPEFLVALRALCTELDILLVADETLTGGRTGKFLSFQHYDGFRPDFFIFGKGIGIAGIASCDSWTKNFNLKTWKQTTLQAEALVLLRSHQILKRISHDSLMENIAKIGQYLLQQLNELDDELGHQGINRSRGIGGLIFTELQLPVKSVHSRLLPPLTLTEQHVHNIMIAAKATILSEKTCGICSSDEGKLVYCDSCPKVYHIECLPRNTNTDIDPWYCPKCETEVDSHRSKETNSKKRDTGLNKYVQLLIH
jgi:hypothetical protein